MNYKNLTRSKTDKQRIKDNKRFKEVEETIEHSFSEVNDYYDSLESDSNNNHNSSSAKKKYFL